VTEQIRDIDSIPEFTFKLLNKEAGTSLDVLSLSVYTSTAEILKRNLQAGWLGGCDGGRSEPTLSAFTSGEICFRGISDASMVKISASSQRIVLSSILLRYRNESSV
jgi:hypothetical protein